MNNVKFILFLPILLVLFSCATPQPKKTSYLKKNISQAELNNPKHYKRYYYNCRNFETGSTSYLTSYFPLSRESRMKENFGIYVQLNGGKAEAFDHITNRILNKRGTRFEVIYRSYQQIQGSYIDLIAHQHSSIYYKNQNGIKTRWLECKES